MAHQDRSDRVGSDPLPDGPSPVAASAPSEFDLQVFQELQKRSKVPNWQQALVVLGISLLLFVGTGFLSWNAFELAALVGILFIHEAGHYLGMRFFGYRDVRVFFIPFLGAAASGQPTRTSPTREAIVLLLGPLPGIVMGVTMGIVAITSANETLWHVALLMTFVNGFNLLPVYPLDGGRLFNVLLFSRQRHLEATFQAIGGASLALIGLATKDWVFGVLGLVIAAGTRQTFRTSSIALKLRGVAMPVADEDPAVPGVPLEFVRSALPELPFTESVKGAAIRVQAIWDRMRAGTPRVMSTLGFLVVYFFSFVIALVGAVGLIAMPPARELTITAADRASLLDMRTLQPSIGGDLVPGTEALRKTRNAFGVTTLVYQYLSPTDGSPMLEEEVISHPAGDQSLPSMATLWALENDRSRVLGTRLEARDGPVRWGAESLNGVHIREEQVVGMVFFGSRDTIRVTYRAWLSSAPELWDDLPARLAERLEHL